jgi:AraC-like DNA-binding protein
MQNPEVCSPGTEACRTSSVPAAITYPAGLKWRDHAMRTRLLADILVERAAHAGAEVNRSMTVLLDSRRLDRADRSDAVTALLSSLEVPQLITVDSSAADLWHRLEQWDLGPGAHLLLTAGTGIQVRRGPQELRIAAPERLVVSFQITGIASCSAADGNSEVLPGELCLLDQTANFDCRWSGIGSSLAFVVDYDRLGITAGTARAAGTRLASSPVYGLVKAHFARLREAANGLRSSATRAMIGQASTELVRALLTTAAPGQTGQEEQHRSLPLRLTRYIEDHLTDPQLDAGRIAAQHNISVRHLYNVWSEHELTLAQWIIRQRLERARRELADHGRAMTVSTAARQCGFTNIAHFGRRFRAAYGISPREWRESSQPESTSSSDFSADIFPVVARANAVGGAESGGEVTGAGKAPGAGDGRDGAVLAGVAGEIDACAFKPLGDDPLFEAEVGMLEQGVELAERDVVGGGDALGPEVGLGEVTAGVGEDAGQQGLLADLPHEAARCGGGGGDERAEQFGGGVAEGRQSGVVLEAVGFAAQVIHVVADEVVQRAGADAGNSGADQVEGQAEPVIVELEAAGPAQS